MDFKFSCWDLIYSAPEDIYDEDGAVDGFLHQMTIVIGRKMVEYMYLYYGDDVLDGDHDEDDDNDNTNGVG